MNETPAFEVKNLKKTFTLGFFRKKVKAVDDVTFQVNKGEIFGLLGPNGAGKTTLMKTAMGLIHSSSGEIFIDGKNVKDHKSRKDIGYLPENPYFHEYLNPLELLLFLGKLNKMESKVLKKRAHELIELVGLKDAIKRPLRKFSKGMLQRIGLAQALLAQPRMLVLDEPMTGLDPIGRKFVTDLMLKLNKDGITILFSSHILSDVEKLCDRVIILIKGREKAYGRLEDLLATENEPRTLESLFVEKAQ